jgi:hypothetical protein
MRNRTLLTAFAIVAVACDKPEAKPDPKADPKSGGAAVSSATTSGASATATQAAPAKPPSVQIVVDDLACVVDGTRFEFAQPDPRGRIAAGLEGRTLDGRVIVTVVRDAKASKVGHVLAALKRAKLTEIVASSQKRDGKMDQVSVALGFTKQDCAAVAFIGKDNATNVWPLGGGTANRFAKGMAGPDMTLAADGVKKLAAKCDSGVWFIGVDDSHTWAKVFDLALAGKEAGVQPTQITFLGDAPVPGRKVAEPPP